MLWGHALPQMLSQQLLGLLGNHIQPSPAEPGWSRAPGLSRLEVAKSADCLPFSQPLNTELEASEREVNIRVF